MDRHMQSPQISLVIPVYNEEACLERLFNRLYPVMDGLGVSYEILFINDGSRDRSAALLADQFRHRPDVTRVILFTNNFGQHSAILAGFSFSRGSRIITLDADLQNPPEDIPLLLAAMDQGHDYVGSIRRQRNDSWWRHSASRFVNRVRERTTDIRMTDQGCMMRAYGTHIVDTINQCQDSHTFIPALDNPNARNPTNVMLGHEERTTAV
jgi:undecaprenyl-phosphate 4-deoxy-4-formamido-L-arabinose transferase